MSSSKSFIIIIISSIFLGGCNNKANVSAENQYDIMYKDSFDILLHSMEPPYTKADTIYTEMYIALKAMRPDDDGVCAKMVCEAKQIAQGVLKDKKGFIETSYRLYNLYPKDSFERLSSLGSLYLATNQKDSADYYLYRCLQISKENLNSSNSATIEKGIFGVLHCLVLLNKDEEAKSFIKEQLNNNPSDEIEELLHSLDEDFDGFKRTEWKSVETLFKVF